jgi:hypothetical protein
VAAAHRLQVVAEADEFLVEDVEKGASHRCIRLVGLGLGVEVLAVTLQSRLDLR